MRLNLYVLISVYLYNLDKSVTFFNGITMKTTCNGNCILLLLNVKYIE